MRHFFLTIYQLKNTSDCIKIDPPGPGQNLEKGQKSRKKSSKILDSKKSKKQVKILDPFLRFFVGLGFFCHQIFYKQKTGFFGWRAPSGGAGPGPPSFFQGGNIEKVHRKKCPGKLHFIFWGKIFVGAIYLSKRSDLCLVRQISSRGSGSNFFLIQN